MKWSSPLVELSRPAARCASRWYVALKLVAVVLPLSAGCSALPVMQSTPVQVAMQDSASRADEYSDAEKLRLSQLATTPDFDSPALSPSVKDNVTSTRAAESKPAAIGPPIPGAAQKGVVTPDTPSSVQVPMLRIDAPKPFAWTPTGKTSGERSFQTVTIGDDGYRSLVIGSVAGKDPLA